MYLWRKVSSISSSSTILIPPISSFLEDWEKMRKQGSQHIFPSEIMLQIVVKFPGILHGKCIEWINTAYFGEITWFFFFFGFLCHFLSQSSRTLQIPPSHPILPISLILLCLMALATDNLGRLQSRYISWDSLRQRVVSRSLLPFFASFQKFVLPASLSLPLFMISNHIPHS